MTKEEKDNVQTEISMLKEKDITGKIGYITIKLEEEVIGKIDIYKRNKKKEDNNIFERLKNYFSDIRKKFILGLQKSLNPGPLVPIPLETYKSVSLIL